MKANYELLRLFESEFKKMVPDIFKLVSPRRYVPPNGYPNPSLFASILAAHLEFPTLPYEGIQKTMVDCSLIAWKLTEEQMPIYFVGRDFIEALSESDPPDDMKLSEIEWPFDAITFVLPEDFSIEHFGHPVPFISVAHQPCGRLEPPDAVKRLLPLSKSIGINKDIAGGQSFLAHGCVLCDGDCKPVDYAASWPDCAEVKTLLNTKEFTDYTKDRGWIDSTLPPEEDLKIMRRIISVGIWCLIGLMTSPEHIEPPVLIRPAKMKHGNLREELWQPRWVGRRYVWHREPQGGTHASPRMHMRRKHIRWQRFGEHNSQRKLIWIQKTMVGKQT